MPRASGKWEVGMPDGVPVSQRLGALVDPLGPCLHEVDTMFTAYEGVGEHQAHRARPDDDQICVDLLSCRDRRPVDSHHGQVCSLISLRSALPIAIIYVTATPSRWKSGIQSELDWADQLSVYEVVNTLTTGERTSGEGPEMDVTVIIVSYNSADRIADAIKHHQESLQHLSGEIIRRRQRLPR